ncbi:MAG: hypothetical protein EAZ36_05885 [Verrucomicrobia bacterium]|nr:MAG: hypothetical protein EAZ36_05885 [Verrucomicrobiota bacterium]
MPLRPPAANAARLAHVELFWSQRRQRLTLVRRIVATRALAHLAPFDAEALLAAACVEDRGISPTSVYRILADLVSANLLRTVPGARGERHYTVVDTPAAGLSNIACANCHQVVPLPDPCLALRETARVRQQGFTPRSLSLRIEAECDQLHRTGTCSRRLVRDLKAGKPLRKDGEALCLKRQRTPTPAC